jgi:hypothetical protein
MKKIMKIIMEICSINGKAYECKIWENCIKLKTKYNENFCKLDKNQLGGCSNRYDIVCHYNKKPVNIEIKKHNSPDWTQMTLYPIKGKWKAKKNSKVPLLTKNLFEKIINQKKYISIPKKLFNNLTHSQLKIFRKKYFKDIYINCPSNVICNLYKFKGCHYIQISKYGLYHLGDDICNFNVPLFNCNTRLRIRIKVHCSKIKIGKNKGKIRASIVVAARPINMYKMKKSGYSLDGELNYPPNLYEM